MEHRDDQSKDRIQSVTRMMEILRIFQLETPERTLTEICRMTGLAKSTVFRMLFTMEECGLVDQDSQTGKYRLGYEVIKLGVVAQESNSLQRSAKEEMAHITEVTGETCNLYIRDGFERLCIAQSPGKEYVKRFSYLGASYPLYCGSGKILLAYADEKFREEYFDKILLEKYTAKTIIDHAELLVNLNQIRQSGFRFTRGERDSTTSSLSVGIFDYTQKAIASLTISGMIYTFTDKNVETYLTCLKDAATRLSKKMGFDPSKGIRI